MSKAHGFIITKIQHGLYLFLIFSDNSSNREKYVYIPLLVMVVVILRTHYNPFSSSLFMLLFSSEY